jgi:hypothetical protein
MTRFATLVALAAVAVMLVATTAVGPSVLRAPSGAHEAAEGAGRRRSRTRWPPTAGRPRPRPARRSPCRAARRHGQAGRTGRGRGAAKKPADWTSKAVQERRTEPFVKITDGPANAAVGEPAREGSLGPGELHQEPRQEVLVRILRSRRDRLAGSPGGAGVSSRPTEVPVLP